VPTEDVESPLQRLLSSRECGSPAVDGYAHVSPPCLLQSPAMVWWKETQPAPEDLVVHIERHADYDGLAVRWGIGHTVRPALSQPRLPRPLPGAAAAFWPTALT